jgi:transcriptional regulator with XRE-family HTH domain
MLRLRRLDYDVAMKQRQHIYQTMTAVRLEAGLTQAELAQLMRTTQSAIARLETGGRVPTLTTLEKLAEVTGQRLEVRFVRI